MSFPTGEVKVTYAKHMGMTVLISEHVCPNCLHNLHDPEDKCIKCKLRGKLRKVSGRARYWQAEAERMRKLYEPHINHGATPRKDLPR